MQKIGKLTVKYTFLVILSIFAMNATATEYQVGQVWEYKTRPHEESSLIYIVLIDKDEKLGSIYHVSIDRLKIKNPKTDSGLQDILPHAPVDRNTLDNSVTNLVEITSKLPDISEGYQIWKQAFDSGEGGVFNTPVQQIIEYIEDVIEKSA